MKEHHHPDGAPPTLLMGPPTPSCHWSGGLGSSCLGPGPLEDTVGGARASSLSDGQVDLTCPISPHFDLAALQSVHVAPVLEEEEEEKKNNVG